jgi:hypothetical protein
VSCLGGREASPVAGGEVDNQTDNGDRLEREAADTEAAYLEQPEELAGSAGKQLAMRHFEAYAIVGDEPGKGHASGFRRFDQRERQA